MEKHSLRGNIVDVLNERIFKGIVEIENGKIKSITEQDVSESVFIMPGFVDAHIHIESSMMPPASFSRLAVRCGTVATVSDPHEIANVLGLPGVEYMLDSASQVPMKFFFGAPSCVPATSFETAGATLDSKDVETLLQRDDIWYLSEMMNYPGVLFKDPEAMAKIAAAQKLGKPVDGHAPGLRGEKAQQYIAAGISTDHECFTLPEALEKIKYGMKIMIREGSAARNYDALKSLLETHPEMCMLCSDDKHPDDLIQGHLDELARRAVADGLPLMNILKAACVNAVKHYNLPVGLLQVGDPADCIVVNRLDDFFVKKTYINGTCVFERDESGLNYSFEWEKPTIVNQFHTSPHVPSDFSIPDEPRFREVIVALDKQIVTDRVHAELPMVGGYLYSDITKDILKITVVNRYQKEKPSMAFIRGFGMFKGAIASTVAHDSHNIVAVGVDEDMICKAVNALIECKGGICYVDHQTEWVVPLPIAGLMSDAEPHLISLQYEGANIHTASAGCNLSAPFMTMSFMALLVIPKLKLSDKGLFDAEKFAFVK